MEQGEPSIPKEPDLSADKKLAKGTLSEAIKAARKRVRKKGSITPEEIKMLEEIEARIPTAKPAPAEPPPVKPIPEVGTTEG